MHKSEEYEFSYALTLDPKLFSHDLLDIDAAKVLRYLWKSCNEEKIIGNVGIAKGSFDEIVWGKSFLEATEDDEWESLLELINELTNCCFVVSAEY